MCCSHNNTHEFENVTWWWWDTKIKLRKRNKKKTKMSIGEIIFGWQNKKNVEEHGSKTPDEA